MAIGIVKTINGVKQLVPLTTDSGQGLPLGAWTSFEDDQPRNGYLKAGTTFNQSDYPALYAMLGSNVVPERFDHDRLGDYEDFAISTSSSNPTIIPYDGFLYYSSTINGGVVYTINGVDYNMPYGAGGNIISYNIPIKKGDTVYVSSTTSILRKARFYKYPMFIKAVIGPIEDSAADQVVQNINNSRSYSTEEVNTGKKWIDGKPIYRKVYVINATASTNIPTGLPSGSEILQMWIRGCWSSNASSGSYTVTDSQDASVAGVPFYTISADSTTFNNITSGRYVKDITIEYTKATD